MSRNLLNKQAGTPIRTLLTGYMRWAGRLAALTRKNYEITLLRFIEAMPDSYEQITMEHIERFLQSNGYKASSRNNLLYRIKSFCRYVQDYHNLPNPSEKLRPFKVTIHKQKCLSDSEYEKILSVCSPKEKAVIQLLANTGLRRSEYASLQQANVFSTHLQVVGKGDKMRCIPLNEVSRQALTHINLEKSFKRPNALMALCRKLSRKTGIIHTPHSYRHYFTTRMVRANVPIAKVSKVLGHSSIAITERVYLHLLPTDTLGCTDCLGL